MPNVNNEAVLEDTPTLVLNPTVYNRLKLFVQIILPGISSLYFGLSQIWGLPNAEKVVGTIALFTVFLGSIVAISAKRYLNSDARFDGTIIQQVDGGGLVSASMELKGDPEAMLANHDELRFKVAPPNIV